MTGNFCYDKLFLIENSKCSDKEEYIHSAIKREKMDGENLHQGCMEVAFEQWTEQEQS